MDLPIENQKIFTDKLFGPIDAAFVQIQQLALSLNEQEANIIPFENSWTAAQVIAHVTLSNKLIVQGMEMKAKPAQRGMNERAEELENTFLNFTVKFQSPDFIYPDKSVYEKKSLVSGLQKSVEQLKELRDTVNLSEIIKLPVLGEITKMELLYFVLYHTQRHIRQLKNISSILKTKNNESSKSLSEL